MRDYPSHVIKRVMKDSAQPLEFYKQLSSPSKNYGEYVLNLESPEIPNSPGNKRSKKQIKGDYPQQLYVYSETQSLP